MLVNVIAIFLLIFGDISYVIAFLTEISICATAKITEKIINGMLAIIIPEKININDGIIDNRSALTIPVLFQVTIHVIQYTIVRIAFTII